MAGATPKLEDLRLHIHVRGVERHGPSTLEGVKHVPSLRKVVVSIRFEGTEAESRAASAEVILRNSINLHLGHPSITIQLLNNETLPFKFFEDSSDGSDGGEELERQQNDAVDPSAEAGTHAPSTTAD